MMNYINCISYLHNSTTNFSTPLFVIYFTTWFNIIIILLYLCYFLQQQNLYYYYYIFSSSKYLYSEACAIFQNTWTYDKNDRKCVFSYYYSLSLSLFTPWNLSLSGSIIILITSSSSLARFYICKKLKSTTTTHIKSKFRIQKIQIQR